MPELPKAYNPAEHEDRINRLWEDSGFFNPDNLPLPDTAPSYTIILPPPNVTDRLHLGHASMLAIQDLLIRFHRMNGFRTLWLPGTDHAAIATQAVVERAIYKEEGKTRHDLGREEFLRRVRAFAVETQITIIGQIKRFGASLDWSRLAFTLDEPRQKAVRQMFVEMFQAGAIYRGERIVNWCPRCRTTLADDEVEYKKEKTVLYTFKYWPDFPIAISTTRPETKLGDTAVAVNPKDERYVAYAGKELSGEFCGQPLTLKIIADREVDMAFGTGALGVTPAHSAIDWRLAETHNLPIIKVIDEDARIRDGFGAYSGKSTVEVRAMIIEDLRKRGLIEKEEAIEHSVSVCYRCGETVEPLPSKQWFVAVDKPLERLNGKSFKQAGLEASENAAVNFVPERFKKRYEDWMKNLRDWCISRQIWFGHSIPVWYRGEEMHVGVHAPSGDGWEQDGDTLDTWFSSGMWTFSTLGWPDNFQAGKKTGDLVKFHPTDVLETGYEIITLWVSRMVMMSLFALGEISFRTVYLHGMVLDKEGKKMSKSKGNGIDPVAVGHEYGTDAVRLSLLIGSTPGVDTRLSEEKIAGFRNVINKLWNMGRYIMTREPDEAGASTTADRWIISRLNATIAEVTERIKRYDLSGAAEILRTFTLDDLADWYLEMSKFEPNSGKTERLRNIFETMLTLWHPFTPFVSEVLWSYLDKPSLLLVSSWPSDGDTLRDEAAEAEMNFIREIITTIRNLRSEHKISPGQKVAAYLYSREHLAALRANRHLLITLRTSLESIVIEEKGQAPAGALYATVSGVDVYLDVPVDAKAEAARLDKEIVKLEQFVSSLESRLANDEFKQKAPAGIVAVEEIRLAENRSGLEKLREKRLALQ